MSSERKRGIGFISRIAGIATGELPEERFARVAAMREPGLIRMRDDLVPAMIRHKDMLDIDRTRHFEFEGAHLIFEAKYDRIRDRDAWKVRLLIRHPEMDEIRLHTAGFPKNDEVTMLPIIRPLGATGGTLGGDADEIRERIGKVANIVDRFATHYLSSRVGKWREMIHGEYASGRDDIIHDRSTIPERWIPENEKDLDAVQQAYTRATIGLNEAVLDAAGIKALRDQMGDLVDERRPMLEKYYRDKGYDMNMAPLPRQVPPLKAEADDMPQPC